MRPAKDLPYADEFTSADDYVDRLLHFVSTSSIFQTLAGGVHIMDFYTTDPGLFYSVVPADWHSFLLDRAPMELLDFLLRDDMDTAARTAGARSRVPPPPSLVEYVKDVRRFSLQRELGDLNDDGVFSKAKPKSVEPLPRKITMGMNAKKIHEVTQFSAYVERLAESVSDQSPATPITHLVDVGSGQNYLGRALASKASKASQATSGASGEKRRRRGVVAVESKGHNIAGAKELDILTGVMAAPDRPMRNKKLYLQMQSQTGAGAKQSEKIRKRLARLKLKSEGGEYIEGKEEEEEEEEEKEENKKESKATPVADMRSRIEIAAEAYAQKQKANADTAMESDNLIQYIEGRLENGDLAHVLSQVQPVEAAEAGSACNFLTVSIHSCGNLSHYGLRTLVLNPAVRAVAIVGCCYNLLTERLGPPTYKVPGMGPRPTLQPVNGRVVREEERRDPEGFPMSEYLANYGEGGAQQRGIRFNITARMMACQAPGNWTEAESEAFFTRHYFRAILQRIFLDRKVIKRVTWGAVGVPTPTTGGGSADMPAVGGSAVTPIIVGSLRKACYASLPAYVRGAVEKLASQGNGNGAASEADNAAVNALVAERMGSASFTDEALEEYNKRYITSDEGRRRRRELSAVWSLMAFSAGVVESTIVADRWKYLREQKVRDCWVESVFEYGQSPRNLVVVGIKDGDRQ